MLTEANLDDAIDYQEEKKIEELIAIEIEATNDINALFGYTRN
jgi:hypothetical protein